jgi:RNA polymerase sigma-70 factor (ECF subfamily)
MEDQGRQDLSLVEATLRGDRDAFSGLVGRYQRLVAGAAWRYGIEASEIEDLVSEVFVKAYQKLHQYKPDHPFSTWLYRLAVNHVIDHRRRQRRQPLRDEMPERIDDPRPDVGALLEQEERSKLLRSALSTLKPHFRDALFLVHIEGLKVNEAAGVLGLPVGTIKTRLMRGRESLRRALVSRHPEYFGDAS